MGLIFPGEPENLEIQQADPGNQQDQREPHAARQQSRRQEEAGIVDYLHK